jgi:hypothetical protein
VPHVVASRNSRGGALALTLTLVACQADPTSTALTPAALRRDSVSVGLAVAHRLERTAANANTCRVRETARDAAGRVVGFQGAKSERVQVTPGARDTVLAHYTIWHFDPSGKQLAEAECILRRGEAASTFALGFFTTKAGRPTPLSGLGAFSALGTTPVTGTSAIGAGTSCYWIADTWNVTCGGVTCYALFNTRAAASRRGQSEVAADTAVRVPVGPSANVWAWECTNGGALSLNGNGTATYFPPGSGGGDGGGSGGPGNPCGGGGTGEPGGEGGFDYLWWGASCDSVPLGTPLACDPAINLCWDTLRIADKAAIDSGLARVLPVDGYPTEDQGVMCDSLLRRARWLLANGRVFRGNAAILDGPDPHSAFAHQHPAGSGQWRVHIDGDILNIATNSGHLNQDIFVNIVATSLLHEAAHTLEMHHANSAPPYTERPFNYVNPGMVPITCVP